MLEDGELSLLKAQKDVNGVSCKRALTLANSTEDSLLDFMSQNSNSNGSRKFEYSIFLGGMAKLRLLISNDFSESVR